MSLVLGINYVGISPEQVSVSNGTAIGTGFNLIKRLEDLF